MNTVNIHGITYYETLIAVLENNLLPPSLYNYYKKTNDKKVKTLLYLAFVIATFGFTGIGVFGMLFAYDMTTENTLYIGTAVSFAVLSLGALLFLIFVLKIRKARNALTKREIVEFYMKTNQDIIPTISQCRDATKKEYINSEIQKEEIKITSASSLGKQLKLFSEDFLRINDMSGDEFEDYCYRMLALMGYSNICKTKGSGDQGVDIIASMDNKRYAFQCKRYSEPVGNSPVQEVFAGARYYSASECVVITNSSFTKGAKDLALATGVDLWDRRKISWLYGKIILAFGEVLKEQLSKQFDREKKKCELIDYLNSITDDKIDELFFQMKLLSFDGCKTVSSYESKTKEFVNKYR